MIRIASLFFPLFLFISLQLKAALVLSGGEVSYTCTSTPGTWHVTLILYTDCGSGSGTTICATGCGTFCSLDMKVIGGDAADNGVEYGTFPVVLTSVSDMNASAICPTAKSICTNRGCNNPGTISPGVERYVFEADVRLDSGFSLPSTSCNIRLAYANCCRTGNFSSGGTPNPFYVEAILNRCASYSPCNGSPDLTIKPRTIVCLGQPVMFNLGAVDPDGDSLSYELVPGLQAADTPMVYAFGYQQYAPFPTTAGGGLYLDPQKGDVTFTPSGANTFSGTLVIKIKQWKRIAGKDSLMGAVTRDLDIWATTCPSNKPPQIMTSPSQGTEPKISWSVVAGRPICFSVIATDSDFNLPSVSDTTYLTGRMDNGDTTYTFTRNYTDSTRATNGPREDDWAFCWIPDTNKYRARPYYFYVNANDKRCPNPGRVSRAIEINVIKPNLPLSAYILKAPNTNCYGWTLNYGSTTYPSIITNEWQVSGTPGLFNSGNYTSYYTQKANNIYFPDTGRYVVKLILNAAFANAKTYYDTIYSDQKKPSITLLTRDTMVCSLSPTKLSVKAINGIKPYAYEWKNAAGTLLSNKDTVVVKPSLAIQQYYIRIIDSSGCAVSDSAQVKTRPLPVLTAPSPLSLCRNTASGNLGAFTNDQPGGFGVWNYAQAPGAISLTPVPHVFTDSLKNLPVPGQATGSDNWIKYTYTGPVSAGSCSSTDSALVKVFANPVIDFPKGLQLCKNIPPYDLTILSATPAGGVWSGNGVGLQGGAYYFYTALANFLPLTNTIYYTYTKNYAGGVSCSGKDSNIVSVQSLATPVISGLSNAFQNQHTNYSVPQHSGSSYQWSITSGVIDSGDGSYMVRAIFPNTGLGNIRVKEISMSTSCSSDSAVKNITITKGAGIPGNAQTVPFNMFPNPSSGEVTFEFELPEKRIRIEISDLAGRVIKQADMAETIAHFSKVLDVHDLGAGTYLVTVKTGSGTSVSKLTVK